MNYYNILEVSEDASIEDIKQSYRKKAAIFHPDKASGDAEKFKEIQKAYEILKDPQKRSEYDNQQTFGYSNSYTTQHDFNDFFTAAFGGAHPFGDIFGRSRQQYKNRDLNLQCQISFVDSFEGKQLEAKYTLPSGKPQTVVIDVPAGIENGTVIKYNDLGDDSIPNIPRGDLLVTVIVMPDERFDRRGNDVYTTVEINPIEAIIGCTKTVMSVSGEEMLVEIRPGVETGTEYARAGSGFRNVHNGQKGRFVSTIKIKTPIIRDVDMINKLIQINNELKNL